VAAAKKEAAELAKQEASERITSAKLAAKKMLDEARDEAVERCLAQEWHEFKASSMKKSYYPGFLDALVKDGMAELGSSQATIYVRDEDRQLLPGFPLKKLPPEYCGGVILESQNGKVRVNKTLEEIFSQKRLQLRKEAYDKMF
jgi:vacuolar-type H+-ATPase subunit E/Vma4